MAYTVVITSALGTYNFDVQPKFKPKYDNEIDTSRVPAMLTGRTETWVLEGAVYRSATQSSVTGDLASLKSITGAALTSIAFKRDGTTVFEMTTSTHVGGIFAQTVEVSGDDGEFATFWRGSLVVWGREVFPTAGGGGSGLSSLEEQTEYSYDAAGLARVTLRGTLSTLPGTSAEGKARERALESPGAAFGYITQGSDDGPSVTILDATDTKASWESTWQEHGESLPTGVNEWSRQFSTTTAADGGSTRSTTVRAKGPTIARLRTAVRAERPSTGLISYEETEDPAKLEVSASYSEARSTGLVLSRLEIDVQGADPGEDRDDTIYPIPGYLPFFVAQARGAITITERLTSQVRGAPAGIAPFALGSVIKGSLGFRFQPGRSSSTAPRLVTRGVDPAGDLWEASATYVHLAAAIGDGATLVSAALAWRGASNG